MKESLYYLCLPWRISKSRNMFRILNDGENQILEVEVIGVVDEKFREISIHFRTANFVRMLNIFDGEYPELLELEITKDDGQLYSSYRFDSGCGNRRGGIYIVKPSRWLSELASKHPRWVNEQHYAHFLLDGGDSTLEVIAGYLDWKLMP